MDTILNRTTMQNLAIIVASFWASLVFQATQGPGSVVVLSLVLPLAMIWAGRDEVQVSTSQKFIIGLTSVAIFGVALEPGWLNLLVSWFLLGATAVMFRSEANPQDVLRATLWQIFKSPYIFLKDCFAALSSSLSFLPRVAGVKFAGFVLPVVASLIFLALLSTANPVIEGFLLALNFDSLEMLLVKAFDLIFSSFTILLGLFLVLLWPVLRGSDKPKQHLQSDAATPTWHRALFSVPAVGVTLILLNALFAVETWLDLSHVWVSAAPPTGYTLAQYVHRGAYPLIVTAILAGALVMFALRRGSATEAHATVRGLAYVFVAQNVLLTASSAKRTLSYIDAFGWSEWRLAGLIWMALVGFGLASIVWRLVKYRDGRWLVSVNLVATALVLVFCCVFDNARFIAERNVERAMADPNVIFDYNYARSLSPSALPELYRLGGRHDTPGPEVEIFEGLHWRLKGVQNDWRSWTWRYWGLVK